MNPQTPTREMTQSYQARRLGDTTVVRGGAPAENAREPSESWRAPGGCAYSSVR